MYWSVTVGRGPNPLSCQQAAGARLLRLREKTIIPLPRGLPDDIVHGKALQGQDDGCQAGSLDLGDCVIGHALLPELLAVEPVAFSG